MPFEYKTKCIYFDDLDVELNAYATEGWKLVSTHGHSTFGAYTDERRTEWRPALVCIFERQKAENVKEVYKEVSITGSSPRSYVPAPLPDAIGRRLDDGRPVA